MDVKRNKDKETRTTLSLNLIEEDGSNTNLKWYIPKLNNTDLLRFAKKENEEVPSQLVDLIDSAEPIDHTETLSSIVDMVDAAGLTELLEAILKAASQGTLDELTNGSGKA